MMAKKYEAQCDMSLGAVTFVGAASAKIALTVTGSGAAYTQSGAKPPVISNVPIKQAGARMTGDAKITRLTVGY